MRLPFTTASCLDLICSTILADTCRPGPEEIMNKLTVARVAVDAALLRAARFSLRILLLTGAILLTADYSLAQSSPDPTPMQCQMLKLAVAQYGYAAARRHALATYGPEAVKTGDKCFTKQERAGQ
jgi:hypothetical protein